MRSRYLELRGAAHVLRRAFDYLASNRYGSDYSSGDEYAALLILRKAFQDVEEIAL